MPRLDIEEIYAQAISYDDLDARAAFLAETCRNDGEVSLRVEKLLRARGDRGGFLERPAYLPTLPLSAVAEAPGTAVGAYTLLEEIGEGGMGVVFMAQQAAPIRRRVALKIIKPGLDTRAVVARFEAERQALALMEHPNIARILDAGTAASGRPYFVMELVPGVPITEYCDACQLTTHERLELVVTVCQAVHHAHQKGVIHRDLKPTNVLVAMQDGRPFPKIIDFGVAKAMGPRFTDATLTTGFAQMIGTPLYMSPEQAELSAIGVDERTDVYALGVLLYELLAGATPFDLEKLRGTPLDELRRIIREDEPLPPSHRFSTLDANRAATLVERRRTSVRHLRQTLGGELDWIVMKCLEKDRTRRYASASELADDIGRYLNDEAVEARPPTFIYRFQKTLRRHQRLSISALIGVGLVLVAVALFARELANRTAAEKQFELAGAMHSRGRLEEANAYYAEAIHLRPTWSRPWVERALINVELGRMEAAVSDFKKALEYEPATADIYLSWLGVASMKVGQWDVARDAFRSAIEVAPNDHLHWYRYAVLALSSGDKETYRNCCVEMVNRFGDTSDPKIADRTAKTCLLTPVAVEQQEPLWKLAELVADEYARGSSMDWFLVLDGLARYRAGDASGAIERLNRVPFATGWDDLNGTVYSVLTLAHLDLDQPQEAANWMAKARDCLGSWPDVERGEVFDTWGDWLRFRILFDEANRAMESRQEP